MAFRKDLFSRGYVLADARDILVGMQLCCDLQSRAPILAILTHHNCIEITGNRHSCAHGQEIIHVSRSIRLCAFSFLRSHGKSIHCRPVKARQAHRREDILRQDPARCLYTWQAFSPL
jgi:hypothetical protein